MTPCVCVSCALCRAAARPGKAVGQTNGLYREDARRYARTVALSAQSPFHADERDSDYQAGVSGNEDMKRGSRTELAGPGSGSQR